MVALLAENDRFQATDRQWERNEAWCVSTLWTALELDFIDTLIYFCPPTFLVDCFDG